MTAKAQKAKREAHRERFEAVSTERRQLLLDRLRMLAVELGRSPLRREAERVGCSFGSFKSPFLSSNQALEMAGLPTRARGEYAPADPDAVEAAVLRTLEAFPGKRKPAPEPPLPELVAVEKAARPLPPTGPWEMMDLGWMQ